MENELGGLLTEALKLPVDAVTHFISTRLAQIEPNSYVLETDDWSFDVADYAQNEPCGFDYLPGAHSQFQTDSVDGHTGVGYTRFNTWYQIEWEGHRLKLLSIALKGPSCPERWQYLIADTKEIAEAFFVIVSRWNAEIRGEVLVYSGGWYKDSDLFQDIKASTLDNLILEGKLKDQIRSDFETFFESRQMYERYGIPWKRGVLFLGPPGNGKTHCIKALINLLGLPCLYCRTFERERGTEQGAMSQFFHRARETSPCVLVFEDLDSLLDDNNRSFFLNELDGFANNSGLMMVATTNHPERLDPAILERPSRFDRKYTFNLPDDECRTSYLLKFSANLEDALRLDESAAVQLAAETDGFSYAYLKELFLSSMMAWIQDPSLAFPAIMSEQVKALRSQMLTAEVERPPKASDGNAEYARYMSRWRR